MSQTDINLREILYILSYEDFYEKLPFWLDVLRPPYKSLT